MSLNMLLTALLVSRLLWMRREVTMALGKNHGRMYMGIASEDRHVVCRGRSTNWMILSQDY